MSNNSMKQDQVFYASSEKSTKKSFIVNLNELLYLKIKNESEFIFTLKNDVEIKIKEQNIKELEKSLNQLSKEYGYKNYLDLFLKSKQEITNQNNETEVFDVIISIPNIKVVFDLEDEADGCIVMFENNENITLNDTTENIYKNIL